MRLRNLLVQSQDLKSQKGKAYLKAITMPGKRGAARQTHGIKLMHKEQEVAHMRCRHVCLQPEDEQEHNKHPLGGVPRQRGFIAQAAHLAVPDAELNWELRIDQKRGAHQVPVARGACSWVSVSRELPLGSQKSPGAAGAHSSRAVI